MQAKLDISPPTASSSGEETVVKISPNFDYVRTVPALVKLLEFVLLLMSFSCTAAFKNGLVTNSLSWGELDFHLFMTVVSWLGVMAMFSLYFMNVINMLKSKVVHIFILLAIVHLIGTFFLLLSSSLVLDTCVKIRNLKLSNSLSFCDLVSSGIYGTTNCSVLEFGGAVGLFACFVVGFDTFIHALKAVTEYRNHAANRAENQQQQAHGGDREMQFEVPPSVEAEY